MPKRGAPSGNRNAYKHGFYAKNFSAEEKKRLNKKPDLQSEIKGNRVIANRIFKRITKYGLRPNDKGAINEDTIHSINTYVAIVTVIATLTRSHQLVAGQFQPTETAILDALHDVNVEDGIDV